MERLVREISKACLGAAPQTLVPGRTARSAYLLLSVPSALVGDPLQLFVVPVSVLLDDEQFAFDSLQTQLEMPFVLC